MSERASRNRSVWRARPCRLTITPGSPRPVSGGRRPPSPGRGAHGRRPLSRGRTRPASTSPEPVASISMAAVSRSAIRCGGARGKTRAERVDSVQHFLDALQRETERAGEARDCASGNRALLLRESSSSGGGNRFHTRGIYEANPPTKARRRPPSDARNRPMPQGVQPGAAPAR